MRDAILKRIRDAAYHAGRDESDIRLIAVSKQQGQDRVRQCLVDGQRDFGENRVREALVRWGGQREVYPDLCLHLIGGLQTNKVREAVQLFDVIHSIDRVKIARAVRDEMVRVGRDVVCFVQVNIGGEPQKSGVLVRDLPDLLVVCRDIGLPLAGLMCIPPMGDEAALHFGFLQHLAKEYALAGLSMGMSNDFEEAIKFGATHVRVGSALFGARA